MSDKDLFICTDGKYNTISKFNINKKFNQVGKPLKESIICNDSVLMQTSYEYKDGKLTYSMTYNLDMSICISRYYDSDEKLKSEVSHKKKGANPDHRRISKYYKSGSVKTCNTYNLHKWRNFKYSSYYKNGYILGSSYKNKKMLFY